MEKYDIKTRIISAYDYKSVDLSQYVLPFEVDIEKLQQDIMMYAKKNAETVLADIAENEDIVTFAVTSEISKFNKPNITVRLGRNLFNSEIEAEILGMKTGETKQAQISGGTVEITVKEIKRTIIPDFTDENVSKWGIEGVNTAEGFKNHLIDLQHIADTEETAETVAGMVMDIVAERSAIDMDIDELNHEKEKGRQTAKEMLALNLNTENPTDEECKEVFGGTVEQYIAYVIRVIIDSFKSSVIGLSLLTDTGKAITEADYESEIVKRSAESGISENELKTQMSYKDYALQCGSDYLFELSKEYIKNYIYEQENKK